MLKKMDLTYVCLFFMLTVVSVSYAKKAFTKEDCEVCVTVLEKFEEEYPGIRDKKEAEIESSFKKFCKGRTNSKEDRFCYYIGGSETSATNILKKMSSPMKNHLPPVKICEKLKTADSQVCDLKYEKQIDLTSVDFKKLKVKDLKKILSDWNEDKACKGCSEKSDFVRAVKELMPKHAPEAYKKLMEKAEL